MVLQHEKYKLIFGDRAPDSIEDFRQMKYTNSEKWDALKAEKQSVLNRMDYREDLFGKLGKAEARQWYIAHDNQISLELDAIEPFEKQVREKSRLRDQYKQEARNLMSDREAANNLDRTEPIIDFDERLKNKMARKGLTRDEAIEDMLQSVRMTRKSINELLGIE